MIDKRETLGLLKDSLDILEHTFPEVMERIYHDDTLLEDKESQDLKIAYSIMKLMDAIEQIEAEPDNENFIYDFDDTFWEVKGFYTTFAHEYEAVTFCKNLSVDVQRKHNGTFVFNRVDKATVYQTYHAGVLNMALPQEDEE